MKLKIAFYISLFSLLIGCASRHVKMYPGDELPDNETVSVLFQTRKGAMVEKIDDIEVGSSAIQIGRLMVLPGKHLYQVSVTYDINVSFTDYYIEASAKVVRGKVEIDGIKGHTYGIYYRRSENGGVEFYPADYGPDFPHECFDVRRWHSEPERFERIGCK